MLFLLEVLSYKKLHNGLNDLHNGLHDLNKSLDQLLKQFQEEAKNKKGHFWGLSAVSMSSFVTSCMGFWILICRLWLSCRNTAMTVSTGEQPGSEQEDSETKIESSGLDWKISVTQDLIWRVVVRRSGVGWNRFMGKGTPEELRQRLQQRERRGLDWIESLLFLQKTQLSILGMFLAQASTWRFGHPGLHLRGDQCQAESSIECRGGCARWGEPVESLRDLRRGISTGWCLKSQMWPIIESWMTMPELSAWWHNHSSGSPSPKRDARSELCCLGRPRQQFLNLD